MISGTSHQSPSVTASPQGKTFSHTQMKKGRLTVPLNTYLELMHAVLVGLVARIYSLLIGVKVYPVRLIREAIAGWGMELMGISVSYVFSRAILGILTGTVV